MYPALTIADALERLVVGEPVGILFIGARRGMERRVFPAEGRDACFVSACPLPSRRGPAMAWAYAKLAVACVEALWVLRGFRPDVVIGTGGYAAASVIRAASLLRIPTLIHDMDAMPGRASRALARRATRVSVGYKSAIERLGRPDAVHTGNPLRPGIGVGSREEGLRAFGLDPSRRTLIVLGGSQGARSLNQVTVGALGSLVNDLGLQVLHVTGQANETEVLTAARAWPADVRAHHHVVGYLEDTMALALAAADVALCRAGASTVNEVAASGVPAVYVPYPYAGGHQALNAEEAVVAGAGRLIEDADLSPELLVGELRRILDSEAHGRMARAARDWAPRDADRRIAELALTLVGRVVSRQTDDNR